MPDPIINAEAERLALSCIMRGGQEVRATADTLLSPAMFFEHRAVASAVWACLDAGSRPDPASVKAEANSRVETQISDIASERVPPRNLEQHAETVRTYHLRRRMDTLGEQISEAAQEGEDALRDRVESRMLEIGRELDRPSSPSFPDLLDAAYEQLEDLMDSEVTGVPTPFSYLNQVTRGYQDGDLITHGARPSHGKTARAIQEAVYCAQHYGPAAFISLEMSDVNLAQRALTQHARISDRKMSKQKLSRARDAIGSLASAGLHIEDAAGATITEIRGIIRRLYYEHGITAVWIDYLNLIPLTSDRRADQEIGTQCNILRDTARELDIPVNLLLQLNRKVENRTPERPRRSDARDSGNIEQAADVMLFQWVPSEYGHTHLDGGPDATGGSVDGLAEIIVAKQRRGPTSSFWLEWEPSCTRFSDLDTRESPPVEAYETNGHHEPAADESPF